ncbi:MAG: hypothetical protein ACI8T1_003181 [Verrucomicrobiales bacterium]|jgi:uncharacterized protein (TIGR02594 family)
MITYSIRSGDTLSRVARQHSVKVRDILKHNPQIVNANKLHIGQVIQIPVRKPAQHPVQAPWFPQEGPPWFRLAERERLSGVQELPGAAHNPRILEYHRSTSLNRDMASKDETPWCSSFVNFCMTMSGYRGTKSASARSWLGWGKGLPQPALGCVVVLRRGSNPRAGHVAFFVRTAGGYVSLLGGNQGNRVKVSRYKWSDVLGLRWP